MDIRSTDPRQPELGAPIQITGLIRSFGDRRVLDGITFTARPGRVTGYLGPNGSGKSTTIRILVALTAADAGTATINGQPYARLVNPAVTVGVLLENAGLHPGLTPRKHLAIAAATTGVAPSRIDTVLEEVDLADAAYRKIKTFSQGMRQRLGIALALLGEPAILILDEPANGLDPEGMIWLRGLLRGYAARGATVLVTSHVLAELERFIDDIVVIGPGRVLAQTGIDQLPENTDLEAFYLSTLRTMTDQEVQP
ncbi:ABC transporter ATP-binding protein [Arthrobacter rhombi]|uniref:ABC transporter ATP-binding protein n=1 Tax=Arthrobacter rhombi TaxID=71253 RepID=UPI003FD3C984